MMGPMLWLTGRTVTIHSDGSQSFGVEDAKKFPPGVWKNIYVPADRFADVEAALERIDDLSVGPPQSAFDPDVLRVILAQHRLIPEYSHPGCTCGDDIPAGGTWMQHVVRSYERAVELVAWVKAAS